MSSRRARVDSLTDDVSALSEKVAQLYEELDAAVTELEAESDADPNAAGTTPARADGGHVEWEEVETAGPDGEQDAEDVDWTPVDTE
ncbi:hypothetical protein JCM30237_02440 [Halolamina litorea]|uniref:Chromosome segregation protein SMC n=1 Tax=Halolamina litorea TaxID=1515593 RepID=A0ABD6BS42_9EURY|nr:hypothetical protein [Halolamina litorea]